MNDDEDAKTPIDQALDVFVFLPVGFLLDLPSSIPRYIERGRRQFDIAKRIGRESLPRGGNGPAQQLDRLHAQTRSTLRALGVVPANGAPPSPARTAPAAPASPAPATPASASPAAPSADAVEASAPAPSAADHRVDEPGIDADTLAIPDYDSLSASQVVPRLDSLGRDELELVRQYENANRGRKTILSKIAQLQAG